MIARSSIYGNIYHHSVNFPVQSSHFNRNLDDQELHTTVTHFLSEILWGVQVGYAALPNRKLLGLKMASVLV